MPVDYQAGLFEGLRQGVFEVRNSKNVLHFPWPRVLGKFGKQMLNLGWQMPNVDFVGSHPTMSWDCGRKKQKMF